MNNTEHLIEEFKKAVRDVRPDAVISEPNTHGDVDVVLPETHDSSLPLVAYFNGDTTGDQYAVWNHHGWDYHDTLDAFVALSLIHI